MGVARLDALANPLITLTSDGMPRMLLFLAACGLFGPPADHPVIGCWDVVDQQRRSCFYPDGTYKFSSSKLGAFEGRWEAAGPSSVKVQVDVFPSDTYEFDRDGPLLSLTRPGKETTEYVEVTE